MKPATLLSRLAPTPSGYLHLGNIANFLLIERLVAEAEGELLLRIDDCDGTRARREFVEHIFETLEWLGIRWQRGPRNIDDFHPQFSQLARKEYYFRKLEGISRHLFACSCSRKKLEENDCACIGKNASFEPGKHALRLKVEDISLSKEFGNLVLWRKDNGPAYHLASVIDDLEGKINLIVRGEDLRTTSKLQNYIAALFEPGGFREVKFLHHPLLVDGEGAKLSKSKGALSMQELRRKGVSPQEIRERVAMLIGAWRIDGVAQMRQLN